MRQRKALKTDISATQREVLERILLELPREPSSVPISLGSELTQLFYHPNGTCRIMALVLSAGVDAVNGRGENAEKKLNRALEVIKLVSNDDIGRDRLEALKNTLSDMDADPSFLNELHDSVGPYFGQQLNQSDTPIESASSPTAMPKNKELPLETQVSEALESSIEEAKPANLEDSLNLQNTAALIEQEMQPQENESLSAEDGSEDFESESENFESDSEEDSENEISEVAETPDVDISEKSDDNETSGISDDEAEAAALAARAAMEAPYEEVVEAHSRRFDPERDLDPESGNQRRPRRSKSPMGLERPRPDQVAREFKEADARAKANSETKNTESDEAFIFVTRGCEADELAEALLEAAKRVIRQAKEMDIDYRIRIDVSVKRDTENRDNRGGRRHRGRRRGRRRGPRPE